TGPGDVLIVTVTATNTSGSTQTGNFTATLNAGLFAVPGSGTASVGTVMVVNASTVTWAGSLAAGQSVTVTYRVQVADGVTPGATLCINTMLSFGGSPATSAPACVTVNCPVVGRGSSPHRPEGRECTDLPRLHVEPHQPGAGEHAAQPDQHRHVPDGLCPPVLRGRLELLGLG